MNDLFCPCFGLTFGAIALVAVGLVAYYIYNLSQPTVTRWAKVIAKRTSIRAMSGPPRNSYFCTFEFEDGQRVEYEVSVVKYGLIAEGDQGQLDTKGALFWDFRRDIDKGQG